MTTINSGHAEFKIQDAASYNQVAQQFDRLVSRLSAPMAARLVASAELASDHCVLDVGTGTGIVAFRAAAVMGAFGKVVGIDLSDGMLEVARRSAADQGVADRVEFRKMDAELLDCPDGSFDRVLSLFALRHFPHPDAALKEMHRVLRPGGRLVVAVGSSAPWFSGVGLVHRVKLVPQIVRRFQGKQLVACEFLDGLVEAYVPASQRNEEAGWTHEHGRMQQSVPALIRAAGFHDIRSEWHGQQTVVETPEEFWDLQTTFSSLSRKRLADASPEIRSRVRQEFDATCREVLSRGGELVYPTGALLVSGCRA
ncbi:MAG: methyltransferase domain-containing protein [Nitrospira sp.]|jgi:ubiquinone/menaquinone biosynthesis C-methylase UbiE|nr:methyltransferase domain-containing protein [Nitrospira sp.]